MRDRVTKKNTNINKTPGFLSDLDTRNIGNQKHLLLSPLVYSSALIIKNIIVPKGYITDFASFFLVKFGDKAATVHDYCYSKKMKRSKADAIYYEALISEGISEIKSKACYYGVRAFGWYRYYGFHK